MWREESQAKDIVVETELTGHSITNHGEASQFKERQIWRTVACEKGGAIRICWGEPLKYRTEETDILEDQVISTMP